MRVGMGIKIYTITCQLGWRQWTQRFREPQNARVFVEAVLGKDKPRWKSSTCIVAKDADTLKIESDRLEEVMESTGKGKLHELTAADVKRFLTGVWTQKENKEEEAKTGRDKPPPGKRATAGNGGVSLSDMCKKNKWDERKARRALRDLGEKKEGRWHWPDNEAVAVEKKLSEAMK